MTRLMGLPWVHSQLLSLPISLWVTMKRSGQSNIKVPRFYFIVLMWMIRFVYSTQNRMPPHFSTISVVNILIIIIDHVLPFLDVLIDSTHRASVVTSTFCRKTFMGLLTNYLRFAPRSYKIGLIRTLIDRVFKNQQYLVGFPQGHC